MGILGNSHGGNMENGNVGPLGHGIQKGIAVAAEHVLEDQMMGALKVPVQAGDNKAAQDRFQNVRDLVGKMTPEHAGQLLDQLNAKSGKDPLAKKSSLNSARRRWKS